MFAIADLVTAQVIQDGLKHLAQNPDHCRYLFGSFDRAPLTNLVNSDYVDKVIEFITQNRINVAPYYELDIQKLPSVAIVSSGNEDIQFLGDYGSECKSQTVLPPVIYATFDAKSIDGEVIYVSAQAKINQKIWINVIVTNGQESARVTAIKMNGTEDTQIFLDKALPAGTVLKGWKAQSLPRETGYEIHSSMDAVRIQINLMSSGTAGIHRLLAIVIRYCLKRGRQMFESYGLQTPTFAYTPLVLTDDEQSIYESTFTIETKALDSWIHKEYSLNDDTANIGVDLIACPVDKKNEPVEFDG